MTKEELVHITLKQLSESLKTTPENFRLEDASISAPHGNFPGPTIIWQFKQQVEENRYILDPLNPVKTIIVTYNKLARRLECYIYNREVNSLNHAIMADAQAIMTYHDFIPQVLYRTYRQFFKIRKQLLQNKYEKEYADYMVRLNKIFPGTHEDEIFK